MSGLVDTLLRVKSSVEALEGNKVKVVVELEEAEFEKDLDAAFKRLAQEVRMPGFRPGKAPRKVLEARIGQGFARDEAFRQALPNYYTQAVIEHEVDVIAPPEIDITAGAEDGPVAFDAVVQVRPSVDVSGYDSFEVEVPKPEVDEAEVDEAIDRIRSQNAEYDAVDRAAAEGDRVDMDIKAVHDGAEIPGMTTENYIYEVGSGATGIPEIDEKLTGASASDEMEFEAAYPGDEDGEEPPLEFSIKINEVQEKSLPELTDEWASENSDFATVEDMRGDYRKRMEQSRVHQSNATRRNNVVTALADLVDEELVPEAMVSNEVENRVQDMALRLQAQGLSLEQYMQYSGQDRDSMMDELRESAHTSAKVDLVLRAIAANESIAVTEDELTEEIDKVATQVDRSSEEVRQEFADAGQLPSVRADLLKSKTLDWVVERTKLVDEDGAAVSPEALELPPEDEEE